MVLFPSSNLLDYQTLLHSSIHLAHFHYLFILAHVQLHTHQKIYLYFYLQYFQSIQEQNFCFSLWFLHQLLKSLESSDTKIIVFIQLIHCPLVIKVLVMDVYQICYPQLLFLALIKYFILKLQQLHFFEKINFRLALKSLKQKVHIFKIIYQHI